MEITSALEESNYSIRQAIGVASLRKAMNQDSQTAATLINDMQDTQAKIMENSVTPHKGNSIDVRL